MLVIRMDFRIISEYYANFRVGGESEYPGQKG